MPSQARSRRLGYSKLGGQPSDKASFIIIITGELGVIMSLIVVIPFLRLLLLLLLA